MQLPDEVYTDILSEKDELNNSINRLEHFIQSDAFSQLTDKEQDSLKAQLAVIKNSYELLN